MLDFLEFGINISKEVNMEELLELALKRIEILEKKVEKYYQMLKVDNELDFIVRGTYVTEENMDNFLAGNY